MQGRDVGCRVQDQPARERGWGRGSEPGRMSTAVLNRSIWSWADRYRWLSECRVRVQKIASVIICVWEGKLFKLLKQPWPYMGLKCSSEHSK